MDRVDNEKWSLFCPTSSGLNEVYGKRSWTCTPGTRRRSATSGASTPRPLAQTARLPGRDRRALHALQGRLQRKVQPEEPGLIKSSNLCGSRRVFVKDEVDVVTGFSPCRRSWRGPVLRLRRLPRDGQVGYQVEPGHRRNMYPVEEAQRSNERHRPIGLGVQGLADCLIQCTSPTTRQKGSPSTEDLRSDVPRGDGGVVGTRSRRAPTDLSGRRVGGHLPVRPLETDKICGRLYKEDEWEQLKAKVVKDGVRNSLLVAPCDRDHVADHKAFTESFSPLPSVLTAPAHALRRFRLSTRSLFARW